jgi:tetratricopeptide (TPR) repeat protein
MRKITELKRHHYGYQSVLFGFIAFTVLASLAFLAYSKIDRVHKRVDWEIDKDTTFIRLALDPVQPMPTPNSSSENLPVSSLAALPLTASATPTLTPTRGQPTATPVLSPTVTQTPTITPTPTAIPVKVALPPPEFEKQDLNSCGPATLNQYLRFYGWKGSMEDINAVIKPNEDDRNVNVDELIYYARTHAGWLQTEFRVGGTVELAKKFIAAGIPYMIEVGLTFDQSYWFGDDKWGGHYLLLTGYDETLKSFIVDDAWLGQNRIVSYADIDKNWQAFNRVYIMTFNPDQLGVVQSILGSDWDEAENRKNALAQAKGETEQTPKNSFAWFNYGTNLLYFDKYVDAAKAYDTARSIGLPQRFLRYQFGPFIAYFHTGRLDDLMSITDYAIKLTPTSEETLLWRGWGLYRLGQKQNALDLWQKALKIHPNYTDAQYAIDFAKKN